MPSDEGLRQVLLDQREELSSPPPMGHWVSRTQDREVREALRRPLIKVIMGVRRSGKSVLARLGLAGQDFVYVNFDDERLSWMKTEDLQRVERVVAALWRSSRIWFLDEVQNVPGWELFVNRLQRLGQNLVITGSNSKLLSRELTTHLTGRYVAIELFPFSLKFSEQVRQARKVYTIDNGLTRALSTKVSQDRGALLENLVYQELRRRGCDVFTWTQPDYSVDFLLRDDRRVSQLIQVCAELETEETVAREYRALHKAGKDLRCRDLLLLTPDGSPPPERLIPRGLNVKVKALWRWLLGQD